MKKNYSFLLILFPVSAMGNWFTITTENLPSTLVVGHHYTSIIFKLNNTSTNTINNLKIGKVDTPPGFSLVGSFKQCSQSLPPGTSCVLTSAGQYFSNNSRVRTAKWSFDFTDGIERYTKEVARKISPTGVIGRITKNLPANVEKGFQYPLVYTFQSVGAESNNIAIRKPKINGLHLTNNCQSTLASGAVCMIRGYYKPPKSAIGQTINFPLMFRYNQDETIELTPYTKVIKAKRIYAFITTYNRKPVKRCIVDPATGKFHTCIDTGPSSYGAGSSGITLTSTGARVFAFIVVSSSNIVFGCILNPATGKLNPCFNTYANHLHFPLAITSNAKGTRVFIVNLNNTLTECAVDSATGKLFACTNTGAIDIQSSLDITLNPMGTRAFIINSGFDAITRCDVDSATGKFSACKRIAKGVASGDSYAITLNPAGTRAYFTSGKAIIQCSIDATTGNFFACKKTYQLYMGIIKGIMLDVTGTHAFITDAFLNLITECSVDPASGSFYDCANAGAGGLYLPSKIALFYPKG